MKTKLHSIFSTYFLFSLTALTLRAGVPLRWNVETSRVQPAVFDVVRGETIALEAAFNSYGKPVATTNQTAFLAWQTNGMESAWWVTNATTKAVNRARATFTPEMDPGAATLTGFIGLADTNQLPTSNNQLSSLSYRAAFTLRFRRGPGARPNTIDHPVPILDLAHTVVINPPWPTQADFAATTTVMRAELKEYIDEEIEGAGLVTPQAVTNAARTVTSNVVTKAYVEGLGIESGLDTNAVRAISGSASVTNAGAVAAANTYTDDATNATLVATVENYRTKTNLSYHVETPWTFTTQNPLDPEIANALSLIYNDDPEESSGIGWYVSYYDEWWISYPKGTLQSTELTWSPDEWGWDETGYAGSITFRRTYVDDSIALKNESDARYAPTSTVVTVTTHTTQLSQLSQSVSTKADATAVNSLQSQVSAIGAHLNAEDAHFVSTNYDSVVNIPEAYVEIKMSNQWITIWREMTRWNRFVGEGFDWGTWPGMHTSSTNVSGRLDALERNKADRAWGAYDSETGGWSPEGYVQLSTSNIIISAGMAYQRTITTGGAVWVLQCNQGTAHIGGDTNGFFRIKDGDGVTQFEVVKGNKQEMGADASGITVSSSTNPQTITIPYSVEADDHPTIQVCTDLALADWHAEDDADCAATVAWSGQSGAYVATVRPKSSPAVKMFVKATYMSGGETYIHNIAPVGMDSIILNGTKYYLGTATISGNTVLTLSTTPTNN